MQARVSRGPSGETPLPHSSMGTPASSDSKGKIQVSPMAGVTPGSSSKKARLSSFGIKFFEATFYSPSSLERYEEGPP
ncbi:UNVERIFIED_CONTAM: hypothetical protein Sangu_0389700 [Sesamum angustifolium]|uniref:Uncharacterized protein n=1 Tax=Sesamum angustifolium TaxID=2727405 RepID=A0AAW2QS28_9LAMI